MVVGVAGGQGREGDQGEQLQKQQERKPRQDCVVVKKAIPRAIKFQPLAGRL